MKAGKVGIFSAILASACCIGPILLVLLGLGGTVWGSFFSEYHWHLQIGAIVVLALAWSIFLRERKRLHAIAADMKGEKMTKTTLSIVTLIVVIFIGLSGFTALQANKSEQPTTTEAPQNAATVVIPVEGMTCITCEVAVQRGLKKLPGVFDAKADAGTGTVTVQYDPLKVRIDQMTAAINSTGYKAALPETPE